LLFHCALPDTRASSSSERLLWKNAALATGGLAEIVKMVADGFFIRAELVY
jgi:hypothetical protein